MLLGRKVLLLLLLLAAATLHCSASSFGFSRWRYRSLTLSARGFPASSPIELEYISRADGSQPSSVTWVIPAEVQPDDGSSSTTRCLLEDGYAASDRLVRIACTGHGLVALGVYYDDSPATQVRRRGCERSIGVWVRAWRAAVAWHGLWKKHAGRGAAEGKGRFEPRSRSLACARADRHRGGRFCAYRTRFSSMLSRARAATSGLCRRTRRRRMGASRRRSTACIR